MLHLTLDTADERLGLRKLGIRQLPLLFCMRCNLGYDDDFVYRIVDDTSIELVKYAEDCDEGYSRDWYKAVGLDQFPQQPISLLPISSRVQELLDVLNRWFPAPPDKVTDSEAAELKLLLASDSSASMRKPFFARRIKLAVDRFFHKASCFRTAPIAKSIRTKRNAWMW